MSIIKFINIWGCSGSGKTTLAKALEATAQEKFVRLPADRYIRSKGDNKEYFEQPIQYCWEDIVKLKMYRVGEIIAAPLFDYATFNRTAESSDKVFTVKPFIIIDSIQPYTDADFSFYIDTPLEICKQRIIDRDAKQGSNIISRWEWFAIAHSAYLKHAANATAIINGTLPPDRNISMILNLLSST